MFLFASFCLFVCLFAWGVLYMVSFPLQLVGQQNTHIHVYITSGIVMKKESNGKCVLYPRTVKFIAAFQLRRKRRIASLPRQYLPSISPKTTSRDPPYLKSCYFTEHYGSLQQQYIVLETPHNQIKDAAVAFFRSSQRENRSLYPILWSYPPQGAPGFIQAPGKAIVCRDSVTFR